MPKRYPYAVVNAWAKKPKVISTHNTASAANKKRSELYETGRYKGGLWVVGPHGHPLTTSHKSHRTKGKSWADEVFNRAGL